MGWVLSVVCVCVFSMCSVEAWRTDVWRIHTVHVKLVPPTNSGFSVYTYKSQNQNIFTQQSLKLKFYAYSPKNKTLIMYKDIFWFTDDQDFNAFMYNRTSLYEMQLLVLASYRFWKGFTDWFITIQLENPRFLEDKSNMTGFYQFTWPTYIPWQRLNTSITSFCCQQKAAFSASFFVIKQAPVRHACLMLTLNYEIVSYNANDSA